MTTLTPDSSGTPDGDWSSTHALLVRGVNKTFGAQRALKDVDFDLNFGEIHALVGENGSGKSTLTKCLTGYYEPDPGSQIWVNGKLVTHFVGSRTNLAELGIAVVYQDLGLIPTFTVSENIALGCGYEKRAGFNINWRRQRELAIRALLRVGRLDINPNMLASQLSPANRTIVALARALESLGDRNGILILDEVTVALTRDEVNVVFNTLRQLRAANTAILFISHRLGEVFEIADRVTVLRNGQKVVTAPTSSIDKQQLTEMIVGREFQHIEAGDTRRALRGDQAMLQVSLLCGNHVEDLDFSLFRGEIVGLAGRLGSGRSEALRLLFGLQAVSSGNVQLEGKPLRLRSPYYMVRQGFGYVPADRLSSGAFLSMTVAENVNLSTLGECGSHWYVSPSQENRRAKSLIEKYRIAPPNPDALLGALSGGNQQKAVIARCIETKPKVLLLDEPVQGVDVGAKEEIYEIIKQVTVDTGMAVLMISSDFEDMVDYCDRVIVMQDGRVNRILEGSDLNIDQILQSSYS